MTTKTEQTRDQILTVGRQLMSAMGFTALGLGQLLKQAKVPKGSFYHYFSSKEDFGCALLELYVQDYEARLDALWEQEGTTGRDRLDVFFDQWAQRQCSPDSTRQCLIVKLGAEVADMSESMRTILVSGVQTITTRLAEQIRQGVADGSLSSKIKPDETAAQLYQMWLGASLLSKIEQSDAPLAMARANTALLLPKV